jgi:hypothetical protein
LTRKTFLSWVTNLSFSSQNVLEPLKNQRLPFLLFLSLFYFGDALV